LKPHVAALLRERVRKLRLDARAIGREDAGQDRGAVRQRFIEREPGRPGALEHVDGRQVGIIRQRLSAQPPRLHRLDRRGRQEGVPPVEADHVGADAEDLSRALGCGRQAMRRSSLSV
jgi:hypothetical protein